MFLPLYLFVLSNRECLCYPIKIQIKQVILVTYIKSFTIVVFSWRNTYTYTTPTSFSMFSEAARIALQTIFKGTFNGIFGVAIVWALQKLSLAYNTEYICFTLQYL